MTQYERKTPALISCIDDKKETRTRRFLLWRFVLKIFLWAASCKCAQKWIIYHFYNVDSWLHAYYLCMYVCLTCVFLLVFVLPGNDSSVDGLVNFEKLRMIAKEIRHVVRMTSANMDPALMFRQRSVALIPQLPKNLFLLRFTIFVPLTECCCLSQFHRRVSFKAFWILQ